MTKTLEARRPIRTSVTDVIVAAIQCAKELHEFRGASVQFSPDERIQAEVIPQVIHTAVVNLLLNAAESHPKARILVQLSASGSDSYTIQVHDDGPGIPLELRSMVLDPHYTTKPFNSGMGLVAVNSAAHIHGGILRIDNSEPLGGACFVLALPKQLVISKTGIRGS